MGETAEERQRRLARQITINSGYGILGLGDLVINNLWVNPCAEIMLTPSHLGTNQLVKFTKFKFKFSDEV